MTNQPDIEFHEFEWRIIDNALRKYDEELRRKMFYGPRYLSEGALQRDMEFLERELIPKVKAKIGRFMPQVKIPKFTADFLNDNPRIKRKKKTSNKKRK